MASDPRRIEDKRVAAIQRWLTSHGGAVNESDPDGQREFLRDFLLPKLAEAWSEGFQFAYDQAPLGYGGEGYDDYANPYAPAAPVLECEHERRGCCNISLQHDHGDCDGYIFTARDYWTGLTVAVSQDAEEHVQTLFAHGPFKDHCKGYEIHAWPCYPASVVMSDLRQLIGRGAWGRVDPFKVASNFDGQCTAEPNSRSDRGGQ